MIDLTTNPPAAIYRGNALDLPLPDDSVDLVVTSPPYFGLRSYTDGGEHYVDQVGAESTPTEYLDALIDATREMMRVTKPSGSIWVNLGDRYVNKTLTGIPWRYAIRAVDDLGLNLRAEVVWTKPNASPESAKDRVHRAHEQWFHFVLGPHYFSDTDTIREAYAETSHARAAYATDKAMTGRMVGSPVEKREKATPGWSPSPLGKRPSSVWPVSVESVRSPEGFGVRHFAAFPIEFPRRIISGWCPPGGLVLDPFGGTGTTALVASVLGRHGISVDLSADYCQLAQWRVTDPKQRARVAKRHAERTPPSISTDQHVDRP